MSSSTPIVANTDFLESDFSIQDLLGNFKKEMEKIRAGLSSEQQADFDARYMIPLQELIKSGRFESTDIIDDYNDHKRNLKLPAEKRKKGLKLPNEMVQLMRVFNGESDISGKFSLQYSIKTEADKQVFKVMVQYLEKLKDPNNRAKVTAPKSASMVRRAAFYAAAKVANALAPTEKVNKKIQEVIDNINVKIRNSEQNLDRGPSEITAAETNKPSVAIQREEPDQAAETVQKKVLEQEQDPLERMQEKINIIKANSDKMAKSTWGTFPKLSWGTLFGTAKKGPKLVSTQEIDGAKPSLNIKPEEATALQSTFDEFKQSLEYIAKGNIGEKALLKAKESMLALTAKENELGITPSEDALVAYNIALNVGKVANLEELFKHCVDYINRGNSDGFPHLIDVRNKLIEALEAQSKTPELLLKVKEVNSEFENIINARVEILTNRAKDVSDKPAFEEIEKILKDLNFVTMEKYKKTEDCKRHKLPETMQEKLEALRIEVAATKLIANPPPKPLTLSRSRKISEKLNPFKPKQKDLAEDEPNKPAPRSRSSYS